VTARDAGPTGSRLGVSDMLCRQSRVIRDRIYAMKHLGRDISNVLPLSQPDHLPHRRQNVTENFSSTPPHPVLSRQGRWFAEPPPAMGGGRGRVITV